jgi:hypothetical protein
MKCVDWKYDFKRERQAELETKITNHKIKMAEKSTLSFILAICFMHFPNASAFPKQVKVNQALEIFYNKKI